MINTKIFSSLKVADIRLSIDKPRDAYIYWLIVIYKEETDIDIREHTIRVPLPISDVPTIDIDLDCYGGKENISVDLGFGTLENAEIETNIISVKEKEMTMEELEKALGHKVKIVKNHD